MSEIIKIDSKTLKSYFDDFTREKNKFKNTTYNGFKSSYLNTCGDSYVRRMASNLNSLYTNINIGYDNINTWWEKYIKEAEATENSIANNSVSGVSEGTVRSALSKLPKLQSFVLNNVTFSSSNSVTGGLFNGNNNIFQNLSNIFGLAMLTVDGMANNITSSITNARSKSLDWWNNTAVPVLRNGAVMYGESVKMEQAMQASANAPIAGTVSNVGLSLFEGLGKFGEAMMDSIVSFGSLSAQASMFQQVTELEFQGINTGIDLAEYNKNIQEGTQAFVSKELVTSAFNNFYETDGMGQYIKENAIAFDTVRSIGNGVGYMAGTAALSMFTFGGSAAGMAATAATAGFGKGSEEAWKNGATYDEGLTYGAATGAWEGLQYYVGAKLIGQSNIFGREGSKLFIEGSQRRVMESAARVVMDAIDSGAEGLVQPFLQSLYVDGFQDEDGNYIDFAGNNDFADVWYQLFMHNGGWTSVATQAAMGGIGSAIGESLDLGKYFKENNNEVLKDSSEVVSETLEDIQDQLAKGKLKVNGKDMEIPDVLRNTFGDLMKNNEIDLDNLSAKEGYDKLSEVFFRMKGALQLLSEDVPDNMKSEYYSLMQAVTETEMGGRILSQKGEYAVASSILGKRLENMLEGFTDMEQRIYNGVDALDDLKVNARKINTSKAKRYDSKDLGLDDVGENIDDVLDKNTRKINTSKAKVSDSSMKQKIETELKDFEKEIDTDIRQVLVDPKIEYSIEQIMDYDANYKRECAMLLSLVDDETAKKQLKDILYTGEVGDYKLGSGISTHNNAKMEAIRRLSLASLLVTDPSSFDYIVKNNINIFHGTSTTVLPSILENGLSSRAALKEQGIDVLTGEFWSRIDGHDRSFVSFTDVLATAEDYAGLSADKTGFRMIIGTTKDALEDMKTVYPNTSLPEIAKKGSLLADKIKCILVPKDKVDMAKGMLGDLSIKVLGIDYDSIPYMYDWEMNRLDFIDEAYYALRNKKDKINLNIREVIDGVDITAPSAKVVIGSSDINSMKRIAGYVWTDDCTLQDYLKIPELRLALTPEFDEYMGSHYFSTEDKMNLRGIKTKAINLIHEAFNNDEDVGEEFVKMFIDTTAPKMDRDFKNISQRAAFLVSSQNLYRNMMDYLDEFGYSNYKGYLDSLVDDEIKNFKPIPLHLEDFYEFSIDKDTSVREMGEYFGDGGPELNSLLTQGMSLKKAIATLSANGQHEAVLRAEWFAKNTPEGRFLSDLTNKQIDWLETYSNYGFDPINKALRGMGKEPPGFHEAVREIDLALSSFELDKDMVMYRGVGLDALTNDSAMKRVLENVDTKDPNQLFAALKSLEGHSICDDAYMSASPGFNTSFAGNSDYPIVYKIYTPSGTRGAYINQLSARYNVENEFLYARGIPLDIKKVNPPTADEKGNFKIVVECVIGKRGFIYE